MSNIASALKEEITRLARKEVKVQMEDYKKSSATRRKDVAVLKREVVKLERQVAVLEKKVLGATSKKTVAEVAGSTARFTPKGLRSQRKRLGLSATDYAKLAGVSSLSIYNWEKGTITPRKTQIANLGALRGIGKKEAYARLGVISKVKPGPKLGSKRTGTAATDKVVVDKEKTEKKK